jgi:hypothetical protein
VNTHIALSRVGNRESGSRFVSHDVMLPSSKIWELAEHGWDGGLLFEGNFPIGHGLPEAKSQ